LDRAWWELNLNKYEKGLEFFEHYHFGLMALILSNFLLNSFLKGLGVAFILAEWSQTGEWRDGKWRRGHPFAYGSNHFKSSTYIGFFLSVILILVSLNVSP